MNVEKNPTKVADSVEGILIKPLEESMTDTYRRIEDIVEIVEAIIDARKPKEE